MKEIPSVISPVKQKVGKKRSKRKTIHESEKQNENLINVSDESVKKKKKKKKKKVKKIKIRLADPNIPDSYICEVFDSSLEREKAEESQTEQEEDNEFRGRDETKQRNFFDVLMSKDSRRNFRINSAIQNEEIPEETKLLREVESDDVVQNRKSTKARNKGKLVELVNRKKKKNKKKINGYCSNTSDDDTLFEVQPSLKFFSTNSKKKDSQNNDDKAKNKENSEFRCEVDDSSKSDTQSLVPKRKNSNILSYFSVKDTRTISTRAKPRKENGLLKPRKLTEINMFENSRKDNSSGGEGKDKGKKQENVKLAPLFQKKVKAIVDPEVQKARMDFLQNGLPTNMKKISDNRKNLEDKYSGVNFPDVAHVQQKDEDPLWCSEDVSIPLLKTDEASGYNYVRKTFRFKIMDEGDSQWTPEQASQSSLSSLRLRYKDLNIDTIFNGFKEKKMNYMKKMEECDKGDDSDDCTEIVTDYEVGDGCYSLWTEVYRPKSDEILGNKQTVARLSGWLKSWKEYNNEVKKSSGRLKTLTSSDDSDDDFVSLDDGNCSLRSPVNICLLSGPIASGKTALVYALAAEFDYNVLEVNSSSRRTGKKLLLDLQEATKSHQVSSGFNTATTEDKKKQQKTKKKKKKKRKIVNSNESSNSKISLILIEDADIFFEDHDEGFVSAISTLVQSSKRPFIFLSNDPNYGYLERLKQQQILLLEMRRPNFQNACAVLDIIAAVEGVSLDRETLDNLIQGNEYDLRKSILELQFWVQSGKKLIRGVGNESQLGKLWWGLNKFLYKKDNAHVVKLDYRKRKRSSDLYDSSEDETVEASKKAKLNEGVAKASKTQSGERKSDSSIHAYTRILDSVSVSDLFKSDSDVEPIPWNECRPKDGLSLSECMESLDWRLKDLSDLIIKELVSVSARVFAGCDRRNTECVLSNPSWSEIRWRNLQQDAKQDLVSLVPSSSGNNKRSLHLDYLPVIRNICRAEKSRYMGNTKRKNRFNHYFRTLGCDPREESLEISCDIFDVRL